MPRNQNKNIGRIALLISCLFCSPWGWAASLGRGEVTVNGRIIASACAIDTQSRDQTITMKTLPVGQIIRDGQGELQNFTIKLVNCVLEKPHPGHGDWRYFEVTFDGKADGERFGIDGGAKGIALQISDAQGNIATPGVPLAKRDIDPGDMALNYGLRVVGNYQSMRAGDYFSTVKFKMDYY